MTRDPDMIRVSARHLRRLLGRTLAPRVADGIVQEIMSRPEASRLVQGSWGPACSLEEARQWLGHSSLSVTTWYAHLSPKGLRAKAHAMRQAMQTTAADGREGGE
jgi:hypothetical protein